MYLVGTVIMFSVVVSLDGMMIHDAPLGLVSTSFWLTENR
jgi:hypothetical protein